MRTPKPSRREAIALFRLGVIGDLLTRELTRGELEMELTARAEKRYRSPGATRTRRYHWKTLQRWFYAASKGELDALVPRSRSRGQALALSDEQRELMPSPPASTRSPPATPHAIPRPPAR